MKRKIRIFSAAFIVLSTLGLLTAVVLHYMTRSGYKPAFTGDKKIGVKIDNVHYSSVRDGRVEWELNALPGTRYTSDGVMLFDTVRMIFHGKDGRTYTLDAKEAKYRESTGDIDASGGVRLDIQGGYRLEAGRLKYDKKSALVTSEDRVKIFSGGMDVEGTGLSIDTGNGNLYLSKDVNAVVKGGNI